MMEIINVILKGKVEIVPLKCLRELIMNFHDFPQKFKASLRRENRENSFYKFWEVKKLV